MQPVLTHVPPTYLRSISATRMPASVRRLARNGPAWLAPMMIASNLRADEVITPQYPRTRAGLQTDSRTRSRLLRRTALPAGHTAHTLPKITRAYCRSHGTHRNEQRAVVKTLRRSWRIRGPPQ